MIDFDTIRDLSSPIDASFPKSFGKIKNTLYSPLIDKLKNNKSYKFEIRCVSCTKMGILEGVEYTELEKQQFNSKFTGYYKIKKTYTSSIQIVDFTNLYYEKLYNYYVD